MVDSSSNDGGLELAQRFEFCGVRAITQDNRDRSRALNAAVDTARGSYLRYLHADYFLKALKIEKLNAEIMGFGIHCHGRKESRYDFSRICRGQHWHSKADTCRTSGGGES
jgi:glycosyltransferase involved in cell wall biosynthesis